MYTALTLRSASCYPTTSPPLRGRVGPPPPVLLGDLKGAILSRERMAPFSRPPCAAQGNKEQRWRAEISDAQTIEPAQCIDHRKNNHRAEVGGRIILVEPRGDLADIEPADLARAQHMLDERQHDLGVAAAR